MLSQWQSKSSTNPVQPSCVPLLVSQCFMSEQHNYSILTKSIIKPQKSIMVPLEEGLTPGVEGGKLVRHTNHKQ